MATRIPCLRTDPDTGLALAGMINRPEITAARELSPDVVKNPGDAAPNHHPAKATLLRIKKGQHTIYAPGFERTLAVGDEILFLDFYVKVAEPFNGHKSQAGPEGAVLNRWEFEAAPDPDSLGWTPIG